MDMIVAGYDLEFKMGWPRACAARALTREQLDALVLGLPWQRVGEAGIIDVL